MKARDALLKKLGKRKVTEELANKHPELRQLLLWVDELMLCTTDDEYGKKITRKLRNLVSRGRAAGIITFCATQKRPPLRILPDWVLNFPLLRQLHGAGRQIGVAEHLELTALVIERYGWHRGSLHSTSGRRCVLGAQAVLFRLGYGDERGRAKDDVSGSLPGGAQRSHRRRRKPS
ncbi:DUF6197 family protein [Streptomyces aureus]|uniref:DUF6197 family protein n=1 Tax=Streptomyces aureus TaxID=193461 RepID=UPI000A58C7B1|nr:hypothetical protein [Streptomyces aureus]